MCISTGQYTLPFPEHNIWTAILLFLNVQVTLTGSTPVQSHDWQSTPPCKNAKTEVVLPYISDIHGQRISHLYGLNNSKEHVYLTIATQQQLITLELFPKVLVPDFGTILWTEDNEGYSEDLSENCYYQGIVIGDTEGSAAVSLCNGVNGYIMTKKEEMMIEKQDRGQLHTLTICGISDVRKPGPQERRRRRRDAPSELKYMEVLLVADSALVKLLGKDKIKLYLLTIMNIVNKVYRHDSLTSDIEVVTTKILLIDKSEEKKVIRESDARRTVDNFCRWMAVQAFNNRYYGGGVHYDVAVLLTKTLLGPAGYAPITGMCNPTRSCAVVKDEGFTSAFIIAHEVAHVIGLYHDGHGNTCHGPEYETAIMATMVQANLQHHWWSTCSNDRMNEMLPSLTCLNNNPLTKEMSDQVSDPLGSLWSFDQQCQFEFGGRHVACRTYYGDLCSQLWCSDGTRQRLCKTKRGRALDGTNCGTDKSCRNGACRYHGRQDPIHGQWAEWGSWGSCSSDCGVGLKQRARRCNNPSPKFGGNPCVGEESEIDTCTTAEECTDYTDIRAMQCTVLDSLPVRSSRNNWLPYQTDHVELLCTLTCKSNTTGEIATFADIPMDNGTPCKYEAPYGICMDGQCVAVGCDGVINSTITEDACGICGGNGSECKTVKGNFRYKLNYTGRSDDYVQIIVIPQGSRDIHVKETERSPHFIALKDPYYGRFNLNGNRKPGATQNFVANGAWFRYVTKWNQESLDCHGPLRKPLHLMVYPQNGNDKTVIEYEYTVKQSDHTFEKNMYEWKFEGWTDCSVTCGSGEQSIIYGCYHRHNGSKANYDDCKYLEEKENQPVKCERLQCSAFTYYWAMLMEWSECSASCGEEGIQTQMYSCEMTNSGGTAEKVDISMCSGLPHPNHDRPCNRVPCMDLNIAYEWINNKWGECSVSCGKDGVQVSTVECTKLVNNNITEVVDEMNCINVTKPDQTRMCNLPPCVEYTYEWIVSDWTGCSTSCGEGVQTVWYVCERRTEGVIEAVSEDFCSDLPTPNTTQQCELQPCHEYRWEVSQWSECSVTCGDDGVQEVMYVCEQLSNDESELIVVDSKFCSNIPRPMSTKTCNRIPCYELQWAIGNNSECSETCGDDGILDIEYVCQKTYSNDTLIEYVDSENCYGKLMPETIIQCNRFPCPVETYTWKTFDWAPCTHSCGTEGVQFPVLQCQKSDKEVVDPTYCGHVMSPPEPRQCNRVACLREWQTSDWSQCSVSCGEGTYVRKVFCSSQEVGKDDVSLCPGDPPKSEGTCNVGECQTEDICVQDRMRVCRRKASRAKCSYAIYRKRCCRTCQRYGFKG